MSNSPAPTSGVVLDVPTTDYWASFEVTIPDEGAAGLGFELHSPWWVSGYTDDGAIICCAIRAIDEDHAAAIIESAIDEGVRWEPRFLDPLIRDELWVDRFPKGDWMEWTSSSTCACGLDTCDGSGRKTVRADIPLGRGTRAEELKGLCSLFMADDTPSTKVLDPEMDEVVRDFLDSQARSHGYDSWVVAFHEIGKN